MDEDTKATALRAHADHWSYFRSLHEARLLDARAVVQTSLIINGAAATAVLAFLGSMSGSSTPHHVPRSFVWALGSFGAGVLFAACMAVTAYCSNHLYTESLGAKSLIWAHPFVESTEASVAHDSRARKFHSAGYGCAAATLISFLVGISSAAIGFVRLH